jgi:tetratricopeptide (TPR) repeat protein
MENYLDGIRSLHKAVALDHSPIRYRIITDLWNSYSQLGIKEQAKKYLDFSLSLGKDTAYHEWELAKIESLTGNYDPELALLLERYKNGDRQISVLSRLSELTWFTERYADHLTYMKEYYQRYHEDGHLLGKAHRIAWAYWVNGNEKEGRRFFNINIELCLGSIRLSRLNSQTKSAQYDLAGTYAFLGETDKAYKFLDEVNTKNFFPLWWVELFKRDPLFDSIRNEDRFQEILQEVEIKHLKERDRVQKWLQEIKQ